MRKPGAAIFRLTSRLKSSGDRPDNKIYLRKKCRHIAGIIMFICDVIQD
ncbi:hypothetical protein BN137_960 [Cronobacter condimenti 1330]|uniref:Uncharacterized protein n=1 Tax=Cronobacter condimenti 1330 TaxID=1073999 RepID=K7ZZD3_9ENTR|nr:hypothetical protein BN137_960 [Cronobacter condimenti 1330]